MKHRLTLITVLAVACLLVLVGAGNQVPRGAKPANGSASSSAAVQQRNATIDATPVVRTDEQDPELPQPSAAAAPLFDIDWFSVNNGGVTEVTSTSYKMGVSVGESVDGFVSGTAYQLGVGFWYGLDDAACPIALTGDADNSSEVKLSDVIYLVNYVLKAGAAPIPCAAAGDVNCDGQVKLSDVTYLVNYVLKAGPAPCDVCTLFPGTWSCP